MVVLVVLVFDSRVRDPRVAKVLKDLLVFGRGIGKYFWFGSQIGEKKKNEDRRKGREKRVE